MLPNVYFFILSHRCLSFFCMYDSAADERGIPTRWVISYKLCFVYKNQNNFMNFYAALLTHRRVVCVGGVMEKQTSDESCNVSCVTGNENDAEASPDVNQKL